MIDCVGAPGGNSCQNNCYVHAAPVIGLPAFVFLIGHAACFIQSPFSSSFFFFFFSDKFEGKCQVIFAAEGNPYVVYDTALEVYPVLLQSM